MKTIHALLFTTCLVLGIPALDAKAPRNARLVPGVPTRGIIRTDRDRARYRTYVLDVPANAAAIRVRLVESPADLDFYLRHDEPMDDYSQADFYADSEAWTENMTIYKAYESYFPAGRYYLDVVYQWTERPRRDGSPFTEIPFTVQFDVFTTDGAAILRDGEVIDAELTEENGFLSLYSLVVPDGTETFRIDVLDSPGDVDLFLAQGDAVPERDGYLLIADTYLGRESLRVDHRSGEVGGRYWLTVLEASETDHPVPYRLVTTFGEGVPEGRSGPPELPRRASGTEAMRLATVQVIGTAGIGSGCLVSRDGLVVTNHHVVVDDGGAILDEVVIAVTPRAFEAPVEAFRAVIVETSPGDDLALLRITGDRWGRPLPRDYTFPAWRLGDPGSLAVGSPVLLMGYPWMGSGLSRSYFTLTRGILSGGEQTSRGLVLKTDAVISGGSSGGAVSDGGGRLLGLPSFVVSDEAAQLTYFIPVDRIPRDWRDLFRYE